MIALSLGDIAAAVGGTLDGDEAVTVSGSVETDSRLVTPGSIFFAMPGEVTDGHRFIDTAVAAGAALIVCERPVKTSVPTIVVASGVEALGALAAHVIARVREHGALQVVGITGSNGKTTTKNMLGAMLSDVGETVTPVKSFNNEVGAPMTMLRITESTKFLVLEMGASYEGDIRRLTHMSHPDIGVVLKVGLAHAGEFGGVEATERAKTEMVADLAPEQVAVLNFDDHRVRGMAEKTRARVAWFGTEPQLREMAAADVLWASDVQTSIAGTSFTLHSGSTSLPVSLRILGEHHVMNALAALTVAHALGVPLADAADALASMERAERWRMELLLADSGAIIINDAYNASPDSMEAAVKTLAHVARESGRESIAVLGEMAELGSISVDAHDRIGRLVVRVRIDRLIVVGDAAKAMHDAAEHESSFGQETIFVADAEAARAELGALDERHVVLVKSSLSAGLKDLGDELGGV